MAVNSNGLDIRSVSAEETLNDPTEALNRKIERWKRDLLDTGKRNKMINYRETKRSTLRILEPSASVLFNKLAFSEKPLTFQKPINKDTDLRTYSIIALMETLSFNLNVQVGDIKTAGTVIEREKTLKHLRSKAKLAQEEQGTNILYLCFGFIYWREKDSSPWIKSPLLMMPATIGIKSLNSPYTLSRYDDEIEVNPTLDYYFNNEYNIDLPTFELKNRDSFDDYLQQIEDIVDRRGWKVVPEVSLGLLSFLKISMYHDLNNNRDLVEQHPVLRAMGGDHRSIGELPSEAENFNFDGIKPNEWHEVVDSDSSQEEAILLSKLGVSFVMQGPPGTGKSQTITNIIAEAMADGKKILFVSEKAAALQVVLKRLSEVHLDDFCLSLHNYKANKKEIVNSIGSNLNLTEEYVYESEFTELTELFHDRRFLNEYAKELHKQIQPLDISIYSAFGKLSKLEKAIILDFGIDRIEEISKEQYQSILYSVSAFEKALHEIGGSLRDNPWYNTKVTTSSQAYKQQLLDETDTLSALLRELSESAERIDSVLGTGLSKRFADIKTLLIVFDIIRKRPAFLSSSWFDQETIIQGKESLNEIKAHHLQIKLYRETILSEWNESVLSVDVKKAAVLFPADHHLSLGENQSPVLQILDNELDKTKALYQKMQNVYSSFQEGIKLICLDAVDTVDNIRMLSLILQLISEVSYLKASWFDLRINSECLLLVDEAAKHNDEIQRNNHIISLEWNSSIFNVDENMLSRFKLNYTPEFIVLNSEYGTDLELLARFLKTDILQYDIGRITKALEDIVQFHKLRKWFDNNRTVLTDSLDELYQDNNTDWACVKEAIDNASEVMKSEAEILEAISLASETARITEELLIDWETTALSLDVDSMLGRFKTDYTGVFHRAKSSYKADIKTLKLNAKTIGFKINDAVAIDFLQKVRSLNEKKAALKQKETVLSNSLGKLYNGDQTDWDSIKQHLERCGKIERNRSVICEAIENADRGKEIVSRLLTDWEIGVLDIDAEAVGERFRTSYTKAFFELCKQHKKDMETIMLCCKRINEIPDVTKVISVLQRIKTVNEEREWFKNNKPRIESVLGDLYHDEATNWAQLHIDITKAAEMTKQFPYSCIPSESIAALVGISESMQLQGDARRIAELLSSNETDDFENCIRNSYYIEDSTKEASVSALLIPQTTAHINRCNEQINFAALLLDAKKSHELNYDNILYLLSNVSELNDELSWFTDNKEKHQRLFDDAYNGYDSDWDSIICGFDLAGQINDLFSGKVPIKLIDSICSSKTIDSIQEDISSIDHIIDETEKKLNAFSEQFNNTDFRNQWLTVVADRYDACINGFGELNKWLGYVETKEECDKLGLSHFTETIHNNDNGIYYVKDSFERLFYTKWIKHQLDLVPAVKSFNRRIHDQRAERFTKLDLRQFEIAQKSIRQKIISTFPDKNRVARAGSELGILNHEMNKKMRIMPLRKLFHSIPNLLLNLKPCLMMSPLSVAYFLNANDYKFDMVIFDEASQVFPQDAVGAIFRGKQVIIAGDTKQLPPTNFFSASTSNSSEGYDDDEGYDEEIYDSILEETACILPNRTLLWHYRSKHEHLISFSNKEIYKNELVTFPSSNESEPDTGVEFVYVEDGYYEPSPKNYNTVEAQRIVGLVREHIEKHPNRSLGIIAFSEKQQQAILLAIQRFREKNFEYEDFFAEGKDDEFFVKNLENVQGDERDTIIFSIGYAKTKEQKANGRQMSMRFGPLGLSGGERRLNVAVTRAKINIKLVSSILPSDIDLSRTESEGIRLLRSYIEFAMNSKANLANAQNSVRPDDFVDSVAQFIRSRGFQVEQYVGCSGYKIDIAVKHPSDTIKQFAAGIECDGLSYISARTARDRDRLRGTVLKNMGWNLYRVWSAEWQKNPELEGEKLIDFINAAIKQCDEKVKIIEKQKLLEEKKKQQELAKARAARDAEEKRIQKEKEERIRFEREEAERKLRKDAEKKRAAEQKRKQMASDNQNRSRIAEVSNNQRSEKNKAPDWVKEGVSVYHKYFGIGTIDSIDNDSLIVRFGDQRKPFQNPSAFLEGYLTKPDGRTAAEKLVKKAKPSSKSSKDLLSVLTSFGFRCIDNRSSSSILWVLYEPVLAGTFERIIAGYDVQYKLEMRGALATKNSPAWRIMFN